MKYHNILTKSALFLLTIVLASYAFADIQVGYIVTIGLCQAIIYALRDRALFF